MWVLSITKEQQSIFSFKTPKKLSLTMKRYKSAVRPSPKPHEPCQNFRGAGYWRCGHPACRRSKAPESSTECESRKVPHGYLYYPFAFYFSVWAQTSRKRRWRHIKPESYNLNP